MYRRTRHEDSNGSNFLVSGDVSELCWNSTSTVFRTYYSSLRRSTISTGYGTTFFKYAPNSRKCDQRPCSRNRRKIDSESNLSNRLFTQLSFINVENPAFDRERNSVSAI